MFKNYFKTTFRNLLKYKVTTTINVVGLAIALLTSLIIYKWVDHELSYDSFNKDADNIYRIVLDSKEENLITSSYAVKRDLIDKVPEVEESVRLLKADIIGGKTKVANGQTVFTNNKIVYSDDNFFNIFSYQLIYGRTKDFSEKPNSVVITQDVAEKYFGKENVIGETLILSDKNTLEITGVLKNLPSNSHMHFDMLINIKALPWYKQLERAHLGSGWIYYNYVKINGNTTTDVIAQKLNAEAGKFNFDNKFALQPIKDIHLYSDGWNEFEANGSLNMVYVFITIGLFIIIVAGINYINLITAVSLKRSKEIGIKKTIGAHKFQLVWSLLLDSIVTITISFILAVILFEISKPLISYVTGIRFNLFENLSLMFYLYLSVSLFGIFIGFIPAFLLSKIPVVSLLHSKLTSSTSKFDAKNVLLTVQFCISIFLIIGTIVIYSQLNFLQNKNLGYDKEQTLVLYTNYDQLKNKTETLKSSLLQNPNIVGVSSVSQIPTDIETGEGVNLPDGQRVEVKFISTDQDVFNALNLEVLEGKDRIGEVRVNYQQDSKTLNNRFVVNEAFLRKMGVSEKDAINQQIRIRHGNMKFGSIIGVVKDFHFQSLHESIGPLVFEFDPSWYQYVIVKFNTSNVNDVINYVNDTWSEYAGDLPFEYQFLDDNYAALYEKETKAGFLILLFSIISVAIGSIGIFGLSIFLAERKIKEIGVRKILGASVFNILLLLTKSFTRQVLLANLIAWPLGYYAMSKWLDNFAYKIDIGILQFILSGIIALSVTFIIVGWQAIKASSVNPVKSLRNE